MSSGVGHSHDWDPTLWWLWCRLAATASIHPLARALLYAIGVALKRQKKKREKEKRKISLNIFVVLLKGNNFSY